MLKSRGRTDEVSVMEMEEWPQVNYNVNLDPKQLGILNKLRCLAGLPEIN